MQLVVALNWSHLREMDSQFSLSPREIGSTYRMRLFSATSAIGGEEDSRLGNVLALNL